MKFTIIKHENEAPQDRVSVSQLEQPLDGVAIPAHAPQVVFSEEETIQQLAAELSKPLPSIAGPRMLAQIMIALGAIQVIVGGFMVWGGLAGLRNVDSIGTAASSTFGLYIGLALLEFGLPTLIIGTILMLLADMRLEAAQHRRMLAAILKTNLKP